MTDQMNAEEAEQLEQQLAAAGTRAGRPAAPQVAGDLGIDLAGAEANLITANDVALAVLHPRFVYVGATAQVAHVGRRDQAVLLLVERGVVAAIHERESIEQITDVIDGAELAAPCPGC